MSGIEARERRVVVGVLVGALGGALVLGREAMPWSVALAAAVLAWAAWGRFERGRLGARVLRGLRAVWLQLPGAEPDGDDERGPIRVHDGMQPLTIRLSRRGTVLGAVITTPAGALPVAFRVWPRDAPRPGLGDEGAGVGGPPVERAPFLESRLGGMWRAESSDEAMADGVLDADLTAALLVVAREAGGGFGGLTFDGQRLGIHLTGPVVTDPERATQLARALWQAALP
ncbi:MAG: hypothetical protein H6744_06915 [Deltaproteobacteria bacterium]|nr:hypothetical protein [Deltaproteobacteria bacterium]